MKRRKTCTFRAHFLRPPPPLLWLPTCAFAPVRSDLLQLISAMVPASRCLPPLICLLLSSVRTNPTHSLRDSASSTCLKPVDHTRLQWSFHLLGHFRLQILYCVFCHFSPFYLTLLCVCVWIFQQVWTSVLFFLALIVTGKSLSAQ